MCYRHFLQENQLDAPISQIYSWNENLHVRESSSAHHQELFTIHTAMVYVIQVCWQLADNQLDALISQIYIWNENLDVRESSSVHHQELFTVHTAMVCVIQVCWQLAGNQLDALISQIYSWNENLHVRESSSVHHQELFTVHPAMLYVIQVCWQPTGRIRMERSSILILPAGCQQTCMTYTIAGCTVESSWWWIEELSQTCRFSFQE